MPDCDAAQQMADRQPVIGIVAGGGTLPAEVADVCLARGLNVHIVAVDGAADHDFSKYSHTRIDWSALGKTIAAFRSSGVTDVVLLGKMFRPRLETARPDWTFLTALPEVIRLLKQGGDDALLRALIGIFEKRGFRVIGIRDCAPELVANAGPHGRFSPDADQQRDIDLGMQVIAALGRFDIGQAVVCRDGKVIAIEGAEGTDRMIQRLALAHGDQHGSDAGRRRAGVLIKRPKPGQDLRVDLPAIGPGTVEMAATAALSGIAVMQDYVLIAQRRDTIARADDREMFIVGVDGFASSGDHRTHNDADIRIAVLEKQHTANSSVLADAKLGVAVMAVMQNFATCKALVVRGGRVIAMGADEPVVDVLERVKPRWRRSGVVVLAPDQSHYDALPEPMERKKLAAVVITGAADPTVAWSARTSAGLWQARLPDMQSSGET